MGKMLSTGSKLLVGATGMALLIWASTANSAPINYGNFNSPNVSYLQVTEDSTTDPVPPALFGAPILSGDSLSFNPVNFAANSSGGGSDSTDGTLTTTIMTTGS